MKVLITGGAGFIGSSLSVKLIELGYEVVVLDNLSEQIHGTDHEKSELYTRIKDKVTVIQGDIRSEADVRSALKGADFVVHLAAETGTGQSMYEIKKYIDVNITGTANLLNLLSKEPHQVRKIIVASSRAVYGEGKYECSNHGAVYPEARSEESLSLGDFHVKCPICCENVEAVATTEDAMIHPSSIYGFTKYGQENMCMIMGQALQIPVVALRYQNVYGPGQSLKNPYTGILSIFSTRIKNGNDLVIFEDGLESRDFVYIDDVVEATIRSLESERANNQILNVGTGEATAVTAVANHLIGNYQSDVKSSISGQYRIGDIRHNFAGMTKTAELLGFQPKYSFEKGIQAFVEWVNKQEVEEDQYEKSISEMKEKGLYK